MVPFAFLPDNVHSTTFARNARSGNSRPMPSSTRRREIQGARQTQLPSPRSRPVPKATAVPRQSGDEQTEELNPRGRAEFNVVQIAAPRAPGER